MHAAAEVGFQEAPEGGRVRKTPLTRKTPLQSKSRLSRSGPGPTTRKAPIRSVNKARMERKLAAQRAWYRSPEFEAMRQATFARDNWTCQVEGCGFTPAVVGMQRVRDVLDSRYLVCHHKTNVRFGGKERPSDLVTWCNQCHDRHHAQQLIRPRGLRGGRA